MDNELKETFLSYPIAVDQLLNASDADVLEIFARLNSYTVSLDEPELRHARYQGPFKWTVHETSQAQGHLWNELGTFSLRERVRMLDDSLVAEMFGVVLDGVRDGGQKRIDDLYKRVETDAGTEPSDTLLSAKDAVDQVLDCIGSSLGETLAGTKLAVPRPPVDALLGSRTCSPGNTTRPSPPRPYAREVGRGPQRLGHSSVQLGPACRLDG